ncbi:MAG: glycosyltransferase family 4 protein [Clostridia bacterium]|nr:glycosyltransferase family 4 protein [Clostridia bacterium]
MSNRSRRKAQKDILLLCLYYRPESKATAVLAGETMEALAGQGFSVDVFCGCPKDLAGQESGAKLPANETVGRVNVKRLRYASFRSKNAFARLANYFGFYFSCLLRVFSFRNYAAVVSYSNPPMVTNLLNTAARLFGCKTVFIVHDAYPEIAIKTGSCSGNGIMAAAMRRINKKLFRRLDRLVCLSDEMRDFFINERHFPPDKVAVIPNWHRDLMGSEPADCSANGSINDSGSGSGSGFSGSGPGSGFSGSGPACSAESAEFVCGYFGNMGVCQDMETPVKGILSMKNEPGVRFVLAGDGTKFDRVKDALGGSENASVRGFLTGAEYGKALQECGCLVVSLCEGLAGYCAPSKFYSYLMAGKPVIVISDGKDMARDIGNYNCGFVVKNGDAEGFCAAVNRLKNDRKLAAQMGLNARRCYLENYTGRESKEKYAELFKELLSDREAE